MIVIGVQIFFHGGVPERIDLVSGPAPSKFLKNLGLQKEEVNPIMVYRLYLGYGTVLKSLLN